jgi:hypothetical protein
MVKKLLSVFILCIIVKSGVAQNFIMAYSFSAMTNSCGPVDPTPAPSAAGITSGSWTSVGTSTNASGGGYFSFTQWGTGATNSNNAVFTGSLDPTKYYELTVTPQLGYSVTLTGLSFGASRSSTGIRHFAVRSDRDNYTANAPATYTPLNSAASTTVIQIQGGDTFFWFDDAQSSSGPAAGSATNNSCTANFSGANFTNQANPFTMRIYAWDAEANGGTFRIDMAHVHGVATFSAAGIANISHDLNATFKMYPNPTNDGILNIESPNAGKGTIEVLNILGSVISRQETENGIAKTRLDVSSLSSGTYVVRYKSGDKIVSEKLIITK